MSTAASLHWQVHRFDALSPAALHDILRLRVDVFIVEQQCIYPEIDGQDPEALHVTGRDADGRLLAYARILPPHADGLPHIGRVVVHPEARGRALGREVMWHALLAVKATYGSLRSALAAQAHLQVFYESLGYRRIGEEYVWDGIPHVDMERGDAPLNGTA